MNIVSFSPFGYEGALVVVEVDLRRGIPAVDIVGLADNAVKEARERMRSAIRNSALNFPLERVLISLSPADLKKEGSGFDLAIALAVLQANENTTSSQEKVLVMGELELSGNLRTVRGLHAAILTAIEHNIKYCIIPKGFDFDANLLGSIEIFQVKTLLEAKQALEQISNKQTLPHQSTPKLLHTKKHIPSEITFPPVKPHQDFSAVKNQTKLVRALQIAAAGNHNLLVFGPPGCGKTLALQKFPSLLPNLSLDESRETTRIWSLAGLITTSTQLLTEPPFRMPHQSASLEGLVGGGLHCHPGEISLAHNGVLFLDEAAEFRTSVLQTLRVPLESSSVTLSRAGRHTVFPANFQLLIATNPGPCGNFGSQDKLCLCSSLAVENYWKKFSGPLLDRVDIRVSLLSSHSLSKDSLLNTDFPKAAQITSGISTEELRKPIKNARETQLLRQGKLNSKLLPEEISFFCSLDKESQEVLNRYSEKYDFSTRAIHSCIKMARTIADMENSYDIKTNHILEAIYYRKSQGIMDIS